jgi:hypothetical protein
MLHFFVLHIAYWRNECFCIITRYAANRKRNISKYNLLIINAANSVRIAYWRKVQGYTEKGNTACCLFMRTSPINFSLLGGNGNTSMKRRWQNYNTEEHRSPWCETNTQCMPPSWPPCISYYRLPLMLFFCFVLKEIKDIDIAILLYLTPRNI